MSKRTPEDRASSCAFVSVHGRQCQMPRSSHSKYCFHHARKLRHTREVEQMVDELTQPIMGGFVPATALTHTLARLLACVAEGRISPQQANSMARVAQVLLKSISDSMGEFCDSYRQTYWTQLLRGFFGDLPDYQPLVHPKPRVHGDSEDSKPDDSPSLAE